MTLQTFLATPKSANAVDSVGVLLRELIDYAGLFPPASLAMTPAVTNFDIYSRSEWNWILGRSIVPAARLGEFEEAFGGLPAATLGTGLQKWRLSALLGADPVADVARIREFNARVRNSNSTRTAIVESVEVKVSSPKEIVWLSEMIPSDLTTYLEIPLSTSGECIAAVAACGRRAKIRTGGETADKFPSTASVIEFIRLCATANVAFKATAGLHHPLRSVHRFTYQAESPSGVMHGFINVFLTAAFLRAGMDADVALRLIEEQSPEAFHFDAEGVSWRGHRIGHDEIAASRKNFAVSFGSCSFTEPIDDLRSSHLHLL